MRIGLNLLHALPNIGGGWNYILRLVAALGGEEDQNSYVCFVTPESAALVPESRSFEMITIKISSESRVQRVLYENTLFPHVVKKHAIDLVHWFASTQAITSYTPSVVTFYDLQVFENPNAFCAIKRVYLQAMMKYAVRHATRLFPMSYTTAHALRQNLGAKRERISVIPAIVSTIFQPTSVERTAKFRSKYGLPAEFWLYVAHFYPHKNHLRLLRAYHRLKEMGFNCWPLVLRGDDHGVLSEVIQMVQELELQKSVIFIPRLEEGELPSLYSSATALVFPSLYEGGAMPVLEAMACGCPVIAAKIPLLEEYRTDVISLFDPLDVGSLADAMFQFQQDPANRADSSRRGLERIREHRSNRVAEELRKAYLRASLDAS